MQEYLSEDRHLVRHRTLLRFRVLCVLLFGLDIGLIFLGWVLHHYHDLSGLVATYYCAGIFLITALTARRLRRLSRGPSQWR